MQQPRFITGDTRCLADSEISISRRDNPPDGAKVSRRAARKVVPSDALWKSGYHPARDLEIIEVEKLYVEEGITRLYFRSKKLVCSLFFCLETSNVRSSSLLPLFL